MEWVQNLLSELTRDPRSASSEELAILRSQAAALATKKPPNLPPTGVCVSVVKTEHQLQEVATSLSRQAVVAIDLETTGLDPHQGEIVGVGLAAMNAAYYIPTAHRFESTKDLLPDQFCVSHVVDILGVEHLPLIAHNAKVELKWLRCHANVVPHFVWDTMLAARLLRSDLPVDLKEVAMRELDVPDWGLSRNELRTIQFLPVEQVARYCGKDAAHTLALMGKQHECLV
jgi:DNA polymerase I